MMRVLHVVSVMDLGGMENFIMNMYRHMDRNQIQFDFLVHHRRRGIFEDEIEALGGHVYHTSLMDDGSFFRYRQALRQLYIEHPEYRIVHGHLGSTALWYLGEAKKQGVPWRILHSHCPAKLHTIKGNIKHILFRFSPRHANIHLACSEEAGRYQFRNSDFQVIPNGIETANFLYNAQTRIQMRQFLGLENRFVVGHVGRFYYEKNHFYLLKLFSDLHKTMPEAVLLLIGDGKMKGEVYSYAKELGLQSDVVFTGLQKNTAPFYQAMDAFVLPSIYEGLPLTGIEAQCAGLPCLFSDQMSHSVKISERVVFLSIDTKDIERWSDELKRIRDSHFDRNEFSLDAQAYDAGMIARKMFNYYQALWEKTK